MGQNPGTVQHKAAEQAGHIARGFEIAIDDAANGAIQAADKASQHAAALIRQLRPVPAFDPLSRRLDVVRKELKDLTRFVKLSASQARLWTVELRAAAGRTARVRGNPE